MSVVFGNWILIGLMFYSLYSVESRLYYETSTETIDCYFYGTWSLNFNTQMLLNTCLYFTNYIYAGRIDNN